MFPARKRVRGKGRSNIWFEPNPEVPMSTSAFRELFRRALRECCGLTEKQAMEFGTHSPRIGALEALRQAGVPAELRQQLGGWMSETVALTYLQLNPGAQFEIVRHI